MNNSSEFLRNGQEEVDVDELDLGFGVTTSSASSSYLRHTFWWTFLFVLAYSVIFVVGIIGNCAVILVVLRTRSMRTVTNLFILNLSLADLLVVLFCVPATCLSNILIPWILGRTMCKSVNFMQGLSVMASVYSLVALSSVKCLGIWFPMKKGMGKRGARIIIVFIWIIAAIVILPWAVVFELVEEEESDMAYCVEVWPSIPGVNGDLYFLVGNLLICYLLPLLGITFCYALIWFRVLMRKVPTETALVANVKKMHRKTKFGVIKMLMVVILVFLLSWLPLYAIFIRLKFGSALTEDEAAVYSIITPIAQWLGSSNSCINPCLYVFLNKPFRRAFLAIVPCREISAIHNGPKLQRRHAIKSAYHARQHVSFGGGATGV